MRISEILFERAFVIPVKPVVGPAKDVRVLVNPTADQLILTLNRCPSEELRGILSGQDIYFWDAYDAIHSEVGESLGDWYEDACLTVGKLDDKAAIGGWRDVPPGHPAFERLKHSPKIRLVG